MDTSVLWNDTGATDSSISSTVVDAKGDLIVASADNTVVRLAVGSNNLVLVADSSTATGVKWGVPDYSDDQSVLTNQVFS
jgi:hypothetical protein